MSRAYGTLPPRIQKELTPIEKVTITCAKLYLMEEYKLDEEGAYQFIRKLAMDNKKTRVEVSRRILKDARKENN